MSWGAPPPNQPPGYSQQYGAPPRPTGQYGAPPAGSSGYGAPPGGYGAPPGQPPAGGAYGAPPPGAPPRPDAPPPPASYNPPPPGAPGAYGGPPGGYGAPPHGQAPPPSGPPPAGYGGYSAPGYGAPPQQGPPPGIAPDLWQWFQAVDRDQSGQITSEELRQALHNGNWTPFNAETCRLMIGMFDRDKTGTIDINEFSALWKYIQDWKGCFDRFDTDRSGNINASELNNAFNTFGYRLSPQFCSLCVRMFDKRASNTMNFDDFIQCCVMLKSLTETFRQKDTQQNGQIRIHYEEFLRMVMDNGMVL